MERSFSLHATNEKIYPVEPWHRTIARTLYDIQSAIDKCLLRFGPLLDGEMVHNLYLFEQLSTVKMWKSGCETATVAQLTNFPVFEESFERDLQTLREISSFLKTQSAEFTKLPGYHLPTRIVIAD